MQDHTRSSRPASIATDSPAQTSSRSVKPVGQKSRLTWRTAALLGGVAVAAVSVDLAFLATHKPPPPAISVILPAIPQLHELRALVKANPNNGEMHLALGQAYLKFKHFDSARAEFDAALKNRADEWAVRTGRAQAAIVLERFDLAAQDMERLIQMRPKQLETYLTLAETLQQSDDWSGAKAVLDRVPRSPDGLPDVKTADEQTNRLVSAELLATAYSHIDAWDKTLSLARACLAKEPNRLSSRVIVGKAYCDTGRRADAVPYLEEGGKANPKNAELQYLLGIAYQARNQSGDADQALHCFENAVALDGKHGAATLALAKEFDRRHIAPLAALAYLRAYKLGMEGGTPILRSGDLMLQMGNREEGWYRRGLFFEQKGRPDLALAEYKKLTTLHDCCRSGYIHMARAYGAMHQPLMTLACLEKARKLEPAKAQQLDWSIIQAYGEKKDDTTRLTLLQSITKEGGKDGAEACYQLAVIADTVGKYDEAEQWLGRCLQFDPKDGVFHLELGKLLLQQRGDPAKLASAVQHLQAAITYAPDNYNAFYYLGLACTYTDRQEDAVLALRHAVDLQPENGEGYQALGQALMQAGRKEEASDIQGVFRRFQANRQMRETLAARCKRTPTDPAAQRRMADFHMMMHEYPAAVERYRKVLALRPEDRASRTRLADALGYLGRREEQRAEWSLLAAPAGSSGGTKQASVR